MRLEYDEDERALADTVRAWAVDPTVAGLGGAARRKAMAELGLLGSTIGETFGGSGVGVRFLGVIAEELGAAAASRYVLAGAMAARLLEDLGDDHIKSQWLPALAAGERVLSVAWQDAGPELDASSATAVAEDASYVLNGDKVLVLDGDEADAFLVVARTSPAPGEGAALGVFMVPRDAEGLTVHPQILLDGRGAARLILSDVRVAASDVIGAAGDGRAAVDRMLLEATAVACAEMVGGMRRAFELTASYLTERVQFGRAIGTFQALQHRAARMFVAQTLARPSARAAAWAVETDAADAQKAVSHAKAVCSEAYLHIAYEAIQMHGGIGMTAAHPIGRYLKSARVCGALFGDAQWHRSRWASLSGY